MQKAWMYEEYGPKEVLTFGDYPIPTPTKNDQLLIKVRAAALNPIDFKLRNNLLVPLDFPIIPGCDMSGTVVGKHDEASRFEIGDDVYGNIQDFNAKGKLKRLGSLAQFVVVAEELVAKKPRNVSFEEAASLPVAVQTAVEAFKTGGFQEGGSVFIVGGAGGVGSMALQLAKHVYKGCLVGASTSGGKVDFVKALGADRVMDYTKTRYGQIQDKYDLVIDTVGDSNNSYVMGKENTPIVDITWPPSNPRAMHSSLTVSGEILEKLNPFLESGEVKAVIDPNGPYHLCDVLRAFEYLETGRAKGKVVISHFYP
ncbi:2-methylene-furan-3-one reductase-like [Henckelia pumila]|uniref:2-methylene-furan-3-one reductase-like n=1 Tax=Henckelia pumila TaxID=405737 RepID=UPI003C6E1955